jgi:Na+/H+ antiporter NhaD/arsenite permease-like protein
VLIFFVVGETLPIPMSPATVALLGAALAMLLLTIARLIQSQYIADVDWSTLLFFMCTFVLIGGLEKPELLTDYQES